MIPITFPTRNGTVSSLLDGSSEISESLSALELRILNDTSISITGEIASPLNECLSFVVAGGNGEEADGAHDAGVAELGLGGDDGVSNVVINCRVSLKLDLQLCSILEQPLNDIRIWGGALDRLAMLQGAPKAAEALELDQVPDRAEGCGDHG